MKKTWIPVFNLQMFYFLLQNVAARDGGHATRHVGWVYGSQCHSAHRTVSQNEYSEEVQSYNNFLIKFWNQVHSKPWKLYNNSVIIKAVICFKSVSFFGVIINAYENFSFLCFSTPMMDLLVQITTAHRLSTGNYSLQAMSEKGTLPYKPSTPIGALDAFTIKIIQKKSNSQKKAPQVC